jgi:hypothetical protein
MVTETPGSRSSFIAFATTPSTNLRSFAGSGFAAAVPTARAKTAAKASSDASPNADRR